MNKQNLNIVTVIFLIVVSSVYIVNTSVLMPATVPVEVELKSDPDIPASLLRWTSLLPPWNDSTPTVTDMSGLLDAPAGKYGFLLTGADGHFYFSNDSTDTAVKFWGTNLCWGYCFPEYFEADIIAARLAKFGFNLVRLHKFDSFYNQTFNIFVDSTNNTRDIDWAKVDRMDYLIYQLKKLGIYIDLNLHAERCFTTGDGVFDAENLPYYCKYLTLFNTTMIDLQQEFALKLLNHTNPYTELRYIDDPAIVMIDVTNENSMLGGFYSGNLNGPVIDTGGGITHQLFDISPYYSNELDSLWNSYLRQQYPDRQALQTKWQVGEFPLQPEELIRNGNFESNVSEWTLECPPTGLVSFEWSNNSPPVSPGLAVVNIQHANFSWFGELNLHQNVGTFTNNSWYTLSFWMKSSCNRAISVAILNSTHNGWDNVRDFAVGPVWTQYFYTFRAADTSGQIRFNLSHDYAVKERKLPDYYLLDAVQLHQGGVFGLLHGEDPWNNSVRRITYENRFSFTDNRMIDLVKFYSAIESNYSLSMKAFFTKLGVKVPLCMTNGYYGLPAYNGQLEMDYLDTHSYWAPDYLGESNWMVPMFNTTHGGTIPTIAISAFTNKPLTVSEYNHFFPQPGVAECPLMIASYARLQEWDAVMLFAYHGINSLDLNYMPDGDGLDFDQNIAIMSQMPAAANIFLRGDVAPAQKTIVLNYTYSEVYNHTKYNSMLDINFEPRDFDVRQTLIHKVRMQFGDTMIPMDSESASVTVPIVSDTDELIWDTANGYFMVNTPKTQVMIGFLSTNDAILPNLRENIDNPIAALSLTSMTEEPLAASSHMLLTAVSEIRNTGMNFTSSTPPSGLTWGHAPLITQIVQGNISLIFDSISESPLHIYSLTTTGERLRETPFIETSISATQVEVTFEIGYDNTTCYEIFWGSLPTASINPAGPLTLEPGQAVMLSGYGQYEQLQTPDPFQIYFWGRSNTTKPKLTYITIAHSQNITFVTNQEGSYTLYFKVKTQNGLWSDAAILQIRVSRSPQKATSVPMADIATGIIALTMCYGYLSKKR